MILEKQITIEQLTLIASNLYGDMVKAVADIRCGSIAIDGELHSDLERELLESGSNQEDLWGFNLYPGMDDEDYIEFDSLINIRPRQNNMSRNVESEDVRSKISELVERFILR